MAVGETFNALQFLEEECSPPNSWLFLFCVMEGWLLPMLFPYFSSVIA